jgi:hypothetical protein
MHFLTPHIGQESLVGVMGLDYDKLFNRVHGHIKLQNLSKRLINAF